MKWEDGLNTMSSGTAPPIHREEEAYVSRLFQQWILLMPLLCETEYASLHCAGFGTKCRIRRVSAVPTEVVDAKDQC